MFLRIHKTIYPLPSKQTVGGSNPPAITKTSRVKSKASFFMKLAFFILNQSQLSKRINPIELLFDNFFLVFF